MIVKTVSEWDFIDEFRGISGFSYDGLKALYDYLDDVSEFDMCEDIKLDVIGLCTEFREYKSLAELNHDYATTYQGKTTVYTIDGGQFNGNNWEIVKLDDYTTVIPIRDRDTDEDSEGFIIQIF